MTQGAVPPVREPLATRPGFCDSKDCEQMAAWRIGFRFWAKGHTHELPTSADVQTSLVVCDGCKAAGITVKDIVSDEGWDMIVRVFTSRALAEPDRASLELVFKALPMGTA